ncbi:MAG: urease accessory protein UreE [Thalassobaculaceae bacterium]|jgi:urease accessory protein|tara:strand:+ start:211 stop:696 length:486 start_codon:yes stop_codon:yes gene_type:complete
MLRAIQHNLYGSWPEHKAYASITLEFEARHRRRLRLDLDNGEEVLLDLNKAVAMRGGDGLLMENGQWIKVIAASEPVLKISTKDRGLFVRLAWHLGNRHVAADIRDDSIVIKPDHVLKEMLEGLGAVVEEISDPFQPEGGAYSEHKHLETISEYAEADHGH